MSKSVGIVSDLHLNWLWSEIDTTDDDVWYNKMFAMLPDSDILVIAGDLCDDATKALSYTGRSWLKDVSCMYQRVYIVFGNHDWYTTSFVNMETKFTNLLQEQKIGNVFVLNANTHYEEYDWLFVGCTLWTDFKNQDPLGMWQAREMMSDYNYIRTQEYSKIRPELILQKHFRDRKYLEYVVSENKGKKIFVVTHHLPSYSLCDEYYSGQNDYYYASSMDEFIIDNPHIKYWAAGHTHRQKHLTIGETQCIVNPYGYHSHRNRSYEQQIVYLEK